jgi:hypothetical protein
MNKSLPGLAVLSLAVAGAVLAQDPNSPHPDPESARNKAGSNMVEFTSVDANRDGRISKSEARQYGELTTSFGKLDTNSDSYLSRTEFGKWSPQDSKGDASPARPSTPPAAPDVPARPGDPDAPDRSSSGGTR